MTSDAITSLRRLQAFLELNQDRLIIDADTHATDTAGLTGAPLDQYKSETGYYHGRPISAEDILREMALASVDMALIWQNPACTVYTNDQDGNAKALLAANRYIRESADRYPEKFIPAGWTDPKACGLANALRLAEICVHEFGFPLVKMNPAQNRYPIDSPEVLAVVDRIVELGAVPVFHFGADTIFTPAEGLEAVALRHPAHPVLAVHMGGGGASFLGAESLYHKARHLGLRRNNIRYIWSAKREIHIENDVIAYQLAGPPYCGHLFCGSDAPYGRMVWNFAGFRAMFRSLLDGGRHTDARMRANPGLFRPEAIQGYLGRNFARFILSATARLFQVQNVGAEALRA